MGRSWSHNVALLTPVLFKIGAAPKTVTRGNPCLFPRTGIYAPELLNKVHDQFKMVKLNSDSPLTYGEWSLQNKWKCNSARYNKDGTSHRAGSTARDGITCSYKNSQVKPDDSVGLEASFLLS